MKQLAQKLKDGKMEVIEAPVPVAAKGMLLVRNAYSVISAGTEGSTVSAARKSLIGKAKERPQQAKQMIDLFMQAGPVQAYRAAMKKLDSYSPLGYSSAGYVIGIGEGVTGFSLGDKVACAGSSANHSEIISVPQNLCVKLSSEADLKKAAYNTLGSIALQGIRQADLRLGECCVVIGLGLLGQLTCLLLKAGGNKVVGIDIDPTMVDIIKERIDIAATRNEPGLAEKIDAFTGGIGADAVIITAAANTTDPVNFAGRIARKKGRVVIVGNVPTGFDREPFYYKKELELLMSCSYGPGRYDALYEEKGIDYPVAYVRWTERRNMQIFQELISSGKIDLDYLTTHTFSLEDAEAAYNLILNRSETFIGIVLKYNDTPEFTKKIILSKAHESSGTEDVSLAFIGAGSYAQGHLLPNIPKEKWISKNGIMTASGLSARSVAQRFGFDFCTSDENEIFQDQRINTVFIATRHNTHADYAVKALTHGKNVFVEKPLCLNHEELQTINDYLSQGKTNKILMVGFNRRFSPLSEFIREHIGIGPMSMVYRVNAGSIPADSWIQDKSTGGGRIIGEVCHFIDFLTFINGSLPDQVQAFSLPDPSAHNDTININIKFRNGSIGTVCYYSNGSGNLFKEYLEIYKDGTTAILKDFKSVDIFTSKKTISKKLTFQDKGQATMIRTFLSAIKNGGQSPIPFEDISAVTLSTFKVLESLKSGSILSI